MTILKKALAVLALPALMFGFATPALAGGHFGGHDTNVWNSNAAFVGTMAVSSANTGGNDADGGNGGNGGDAGNGGDDNEDNDDNTGNGGNAGNGGDGSTGGYVSTGDARATTFVDTDVNSNRTVVSAGHHSNTDDVNVRNRNRAMVLTVAFAGANTGDNVAYGGDGGDAGNGGAGGDDNEDNDDNTGNGGNAGNGGDADGGGGGWVETGNAGAYTDVVTVTNRNVTRVRR